MATGAPLDVPVVFLHGGVTVYGQLGENGHVWEVAGIRREPGGQESTLHCVNVYETSSSARLLDRWLSRSHFENYLLPVVTEKDLCTELVKLFAGGAYFVSSETPFNPSLITKMLKRHGHEPPWNPAPINVVDIAAEKLNMRPPYGWNTVSRAFGIDPERGETMMDYVEQTRDLYDAVMGQGDASEYDAVMNRTPVRAPELALTRDAHPATKNLLRWFEYGPLSDQLAKVSVEFLEMALRLANDLDDGPELTTGLQKLLEAKDAAVRAAIETEAKK